MRLRQGVVCEDSQRVAVACVPAFSYAFQPIVDVVAREVYSYEALIRGRANEPAFHVQQKCPRNRSCDRNVDLRAHASALNSGGCVGLSFAT